MLFLCMYVCMCVGVGRYAFSLKSLHTLCVCIINNSYYKCGYRENISGFICELAAYQMKPVVEWPV